MNTLTQLRSLAIGRANRLQKIHRHLETLMPAFRAWLAGELFVGGRGNFRDRSTREVPAWNQLARELFPTVGDFAFAAAVLGSVEPTFTAPKVEQEKPAGRVNVIALATAHAA